MNKQIVGVLVLLCILVMARYSDGDCHYPEYLQTRDENHVWTIRYSEEKVTIRIKDQTIFQKSCKGPKLDDCQEIRRYCEYAYDGNRFKVKEVIRGSSMNTVIRCVQFLKRSNRVVQIKQSNALESRLVSACNDDMLLLDQHPMISSIESEYTECPLNGGFDFQLYLDDSSGPVCDDVFLPLRVESDCTHREGMNFYFRRRDCLVDLVGTKFYEDPIKVKCFGTWQYNQYTFSVVKWSGTSDFWCIRVLCKEDKEPVEVVIFFSGRCSTGNSKYYRKATLKHLDRHFVNNICEDEVLICRYQDLCSTDHRDFCKLTCSVCTPELEEQPCMLPRAFHGKWNSLRDPMKYAVVISNSTFTHMDTSNLKTEGVIKLDWQCVQSAEDERSYRKRVLKVKFTNGCYPRYTCINMELPAHSVMRFRTGSELTWPIESVHQVCEDRYFDYRPLINQSSYITRTAVPWLYFVHDDPRYVSCNLPWYIPKLSAFTMYRSMSMNGSTGCLTTGAGSQNYHFTLSYTFKNSQNQWKVYASNTYVCLASIRAIGENDLLISQDINDGKYTCWTFIEHKFQNSIYVFEAKDCGHGTNLQLVESNRRNAVARFVISEDSEDCNFMQESKNTMTRRSDEELSNLTVDSASSTLAYSLLVIHLYWIVCVLYRYR